MTLSVIIGTYNRAAMVEQAIKSVFAQSRRPDELIVSDDCSTDATPSVLSRLAAEHPSLIRIYRREENSGGIRNWNEAIARASGDLLAFCCDDDRYAPGHLQASCAYLASHPAIGLVHSSFIDVVETPDSSFTEPRPLRSQAPIEIGRDDLISYMTRYYDWPFHPSTLVVRREIWEASGGYNPAYSLADTDWFVRVIETTRAAMLPRHGVFNRRHPGNWSNRLGSARMQREIFEIVDGAIARLWEDHAIGRTIWRAVWRSNVRLRLLLTLLQRLRSGHTEPAQAAWTAMLQHTGRSAPQWIEHAGSGLIERWCRHRKPQHAAPRRTVSPL